MLFFTISVLCSSCGKEFKNPATYGAHRRNSSCSDKIRTCQKCGKTFKHSDGYKRHYEFCVEGKKFTCTLCGKTLQSNNSLQRHITECVMKEEVKRGNLEFQCTLCNRFFVNYRSLYKHNYNKHRDPKEFTCEACGAKFQSLYAKQRHLKEACKAISDKVIHSCPQPNCKAAYKQYCSLRAHHKRKHGCPIGASEVSSAEHICDECGKGFQRATNLKRHIDSQICQKKNKPIKEKQRFGCEKCGRSFDRKGCLTRHLTQRKSACVIKCTYCELDFISHATLQRHLNRRRNFDHNVPCPAEEHVCPVCRIVYGYRESLHMHLSKGVCGVLATYADDTFLSTHTAPITDGVGKVFPADSIACGIFKFTIFSFWA